MYRFRLPPSVFRLPPSTPSPVPSNRFSSLMYMYRSLSCNYYRLACIRLRSSSLGSVVRGRTSNSSPSCGAGSHRRSSCRSSAGGTLYSCWTFSGRSDERREGTRDERRRERRGEEKRAEREKRDAFTYPVYASLPIGILTYIGSLLHSSLLLSAPLRSSPPFSSLTRARHSGP